MKYKLLFISLLGSSIVFAEPRMSVISSPSVSNITTKPQVPALKSPKVNIPNLPPAVASGNAPLSIIEQDNSNKPLPLKKRARVRKIKKVDESINDNISTNGGLKVIENGKVSIEKIQAPLSMIASKTQIASIPLSNTPIPIQKENINDLKQEINSLKKELENLRKNK